MAMVSGRVLGFLHVACARSGLDYATLAAGLDELSGPRIPSKVKWDTVVKILERLEHALGDPRALEELGRTVDDVPVMGPLRAVLGLFARPSLIYRAISTWFGPSLVPLIEATFEELADGRLRLTMRIPEELPGSAAFFRYTHGAYRRVPFMVGQPESIVEAQISPRHAEYLITPPPDATVPSRLGRAVRSLTGGSEALKELAGQQGELRSAYTELLRSRGDLEQLLALLPIGVVAVREGRLSYANPPALSVLGLAGFSEMRDRSLVEVVEASDREAIQAWLDGNVPYATSVEAVFSRPGAEPAILELSRPRAFAYRGAPALLLTLRDVTSTRRLEDQLRQAQKMESVGRLAGGVAHDFNNLLSVIISRAGMSLQEAEPGTQLAEDLQEIKRAGDRAAGLTRQLLAFSRRQVLQPQRIDVNEIVGNLTRMLKTLIGEAFELVTALKPKLPEVLVDAGQLEQVIMNLVINARDAMPSGGRITVETGEAVLDESYARDRVGVTPGPHVLLVVSDSGEGMSKAVLARIFEPFFTTKEQGKGTGLGLSTCEGIVKQSGGHIWVYSEPGHGTTFKVYFPRAPSEDGEVAEAAPVQTRAPLSGQRVVLLVEDDEQVRDIARTILQRAGYEVLAVGRPEEATALAQQHDGPIHLLLTDVVMPKLNGRQLAEQLQALRPQLAVLFMSGYTESVITQHGVIDVGVHFLPKPLTPAGLLDAVEKALSA